MTRTTTLAALVVALMLATTGLASVGSAATTDAGDASTSATSAAPLAQDTTEEENETDDGSEMQGNESANATASITFEDQPFNGSAVVVNETNLSDGGFVAVFDQDVELLGNSSYLEPGEYENVTIELNATIDREQVLVATPHMDTNGNETFDFNATEAEEVGPANATDGPYLENDVPVSDVAFVTPENASTQRMTAALKAAE